jgi:hypothetical protein
MPVKPAFASQSPVTGCECDHSRMQMRSLISHWPFSRTSVST